MEKLSFATGLVYHVHPMEDIDEYIRLGLKQHKEMGFAAADFGFRLIAAMGEDWEKHVDTALANAERYGVRFGISHLPFVGQKAGLPEGETYAASVYRCMDAFKRAGVDYAVMHPNSTSLPVRGYDEAGEFARVIEFLTPFAEYAQKIGLSMVVENMRVIHNGEPCRRYLGHPDEICKVADALGIGICWDTGHANIVGLNQAEAIRQLGSRLKMVHLNDNLGDDDIHLAPFCGTVDWADVMRGLADVGFEGYLNFELATGRKPAPVRTSFGRHIIDIGHQLREMMK